MPTPTPSRPQPPANTIITEQSFAVAPELLGQPLATPTRRAMAMLIDLLLLALLVNAGTLFFGLAAAYTLWRVSARFAGSDAGRLAGGGRLAIRATAALVLFLFAMSGGRTLTRHADRLLHPKQRAERVARHREVPAPTDVAALGGATFQETPDPEPAASGDDSLAALRARLREARAENRALAKQLAGADEPRGAFSFLAETADELGLGFGWAGLYFTAFLALWRGQTPGKRLLGIRVVQLDGKPLGWWASFERFGGYGASVFTGLLGFAQLLWDRNRQAMHDKISETVVVRV